MLFDYDKIALEHVNLIPSDTRAIDHFSQW